MKKSIVLVTLWCGVLAAGCAYRRSTFSGMVQSETSDTVALSADIDPSLADGGVQLAVQLPYQTWSSKRVSRLENNHRVFLLSHPSGATIEIALYAAVTGDGPVSPKAFVVAKRLEMAKNHLIINDIATDQPVGFRAGADTGVYGFMYAKDKGEGANTPAGEILAFRLNAHKLIVQVTGNWPFAYHSEMVDQLERIAQSIVVVRPAGQRGAF